MGPRPSGSISMAIAIQRSTVRSRQQLDKVAHSSLFGLSNPPAIELARALIRIVPKGLTRVFYSDDGSTAVEIALKMAVQYWQLRRPEAGPKNTFLHLKLAYHGDTVGAVSVGNIDLFHGRFKSLLFATAEADPPYCYRCPLSLTFPSCQMACLDPIEQILKERHHELAGFIIEPLVQAAAGMLTSPPGYLKRIRELCSKYNVLLIADEVATGFGRTGKMFACQHEGVTPDLMAISKGLTGGYMPLATTLTTDEIYKAFLGTYADFKTFFHGHSYTGNPLGCAVALFDDAIVYITLGVVLGGRLAYVVFYDPLRFLREPLEIPAIWHGGMSFHGGFLGAVLALVLVARANGISPYSMLDVAAAVTPIGLFLGRIANFIKPELWGRPTDVAWGMVFPGSDGQVRHPSQLYEAGLEGIVLFIVLALFVRGGAFRRPGLIGGLFVGGYALARITAEFFREPDPQLGFIAGGFATMGMLLSLPMLAVGIWAVIRAMRRPPAEDVGPALAVGAA